MLDSVKIARRQSEIRQSLAGIVGKDHGTYKFMISPRFLPLADFQPADISLQWPP